MNPFSLVLQYVIELPTFSPHVRGDRIGSQCVHVITAEQIEMQAQSVFDQIAEIHVSNTKGKK